MYTTKIILLMIFIINKLIKLILHLYILLDAKYKGSGIVYNHSIIEYFASHSLAKKLKFNKAN